MVEQGSELNAHLAQRVRALRAQANLSLDLLATRSGVSRSMISLIERGETSPTAVVLEKLASALGLTLSALFEGARTLADSESPVARQSEQPVWRDPASGYVRRSVSPASSTQPFQIVEVRFPALGRVTFETGVREARVFQQIWILEGAMEITLGTESHRLREGDCLAMRLDQPTMFHNPSRKTARYVVVISSENAWKR